MSRLTALTRRPWLVAVCVAIALGVVALVVFLLGADDASNEPDEPPPTSTTVSLPAPDVDQARTTVAYLEDEGAPLLEMHAEATNLVEDVAAERCRGTVTALDAAAPADQVLGLMGEVPDDVLSEAFIEERSALGVTLTACVRGDDDQPLVDRVRTLRAAIQIVDQRLDEIRSAA